MAYVYRRPFDYPQHRQAFNHWYLAGAVEAATASAAFTTFAASVTSSTTAEQPSRAVRFSAAGIYRRRWDYAYQQARVNLFYTDAVDIGAIPTAAGFTTSAAYVQLGTVAGTDIATEADTAALTTYAATVTGGRRDPLEDAVGTFTTYPAVMERTYGLGVSRIGHVPAKGSGNYTPGTVRGSRKSGRKYSLTNELTKRK